MPTGSMNEVARGNPTAQTFYFEVLLAHCCPFDSRDLPTLRKEQNTRYVHARTLSFCFSLPQFYN